MKAVLRKQPGDAHQLYIDEYPVPEIKGNELLVKVKAAAVNRTDILQRQQEKGYLNHDIIGVEVAGEVTLAGLHTNITPGTRVMGLVNGGAYAEYVAMPANRAIIVPDNISYTQAAAIPEVFLTAFQTLYWLGKLDRKESVLVHAGGSGVGTAAIQLAKQLSDATIYTTAGSRQKLDMTKKLGADVTINYKTENFAEEVLNHSRQKGVDVILDFIGASYFEKNYQSIAVDGRWVLIGTLGGAQVSDFNIFEMMSKRIHLLGTLLTPRSDEYKAALTSDFIKTALPLIASGHIEPIVDSVFPLESISEAHLHMEANKNIGKIVLKVND